MSDAPSYNLPADVLNMIIDYVPLHRYNICIQVSCFNRISTIHSRLQTAYILYALMKDAIMRNDVAYCEQFYHPDNFASRHLLRDWASADYIRTSGVDYKIWEEAVKYGRIEILDLFKVIDHKYFYSRKGKPVLVFNSSLLYEISNTDTLAWILNYFDNSVMFETHIHTIVLKAVRLESIAALEYLYRKKYEGPVHDHSYLVTALTYTDAFKKALTIIREIRQRPMIFKWFQDHPLEETIDWDV
jgi:hypothetical protein